MKFFIFGCCYENRVQRADGFARSGSLLLECDGIAETLQSMNQVSSEVMFVEFVEVEIPQFVVTDPVGKHVVDGHQDLVGYRYCSALVASSSFESVKFASQVSAFGFCRRVGSLH